MTMKMIASAFLVVLVASLGDAITCNYEQSYDGTMEVPWKPMGECTPASTHSIREYAPSHWAVASPTPYRRMNFGGGEFGKLFQYITTNGIKMTTPVLNLHTKKTRVFWGMQRTYWEMEWMGFYLNSDVRPTPTDPAVKLEDLPTMTVFVKEYSGYSSSQTNLWYLDQLKKELDMAGLQYDDSTYYSAGYNDPMTYYQNRRNEVWLKKL